MVVEAQRSEHRLEQLALVSALNQPAVPYLLRQRPLPLEARLVEVHQGLGQIQVLASVPARAHLVDLEVPRLQQALVLEALERQVVTSLADLTHRRLELPPAQLRRPLARADSLPKQV